MPKIHVIGGVSDKDAPVAAPIPELLQVADVLAGAVVVTPETTKPAKKTASRPRTA